MHSHSLFLSGRIHPNFPHVRQSDDSWGKMCSEWSEVTPVTHKRQLLMNESMVELPAGGSFSTKSRRVGRSPFLQSSPVKRGSGTPVIQEDGSTGILSFFVGAGSCPSPGTSSSAIPADAMVQPAAAAPVENEEARAQRLLSEYF